MIIPFEQISSDALTGLIEEFISREGTDYGWEEVAMATKVEQLKRQLVKGDIAVVFDPATESVSLLTQQQLKKLEL